MGTGTSRLGKARQGKTTVKPVVLARVVYIQLLEMVIRPESDERWGEQCSSLATNHIKNYAKIRFGTKSKQSY